MKLENLKTLSLEQQVEYLESRSLLYRVVYIYDIIDKHSSLDEFKDLLLEYKPILTALRSINLEIKNNLVKNYESDKDFKRSRIVGILKHKDLTPLLRDEDLKKCFSENISVKN
jgi:hypothetical protein